MAAFELLPGESTDDIPGIVLVVHVSQIAVCVLCQSLLADEVSLLDIIAIGVFHG